MDKAGGILKNAYPRFQKGTVVGPCHLKNRLLVRHMGRDKAHVHPTFGSAAKSGIYAVTDDQVGGHDIDIAFGLSDQVEVYRLPYRLSVQGAVGIGLDPAARSLPCFQRQGGGTVAIVILPLSAGILPHGKKHDRHRPDCLPLQQDGVVLPVAILQAAVHILVGQIHSPGKSGMTVNDTDLPMIPVIEPHRQNGYKTVTYLTVDSPSLQLPFIPLGQSVKAAHIIVDDPHIHPLADFLFQDLKNTVPNLSKINDKILQKDIALRSPKLFQQGLKCLVSQRKVAGPGVGVQRTVGIFLQIARLIHRIPAKGGKTLRFLVRVGHHMAVHALHLLSHLLRQPVPPAQEVKQPPKHRHQQNGNDPGDLVARIAFLVDDMKHREQRDHYADQVYIEKIFGKAQDGRGKKSHLKQQQKGHQDCPVSHKGQKFFNVHPASPLSL